MTALFGSALVAAAFLASVVAGDERRMWIYGFACVWWAITWWLVERHNAP